jgi:hypothetical protein
LRGQIPTLNKPEWVHETESGPYNPTIDGITPTYARKRMEQEWEQNRETWAIRKGFLHRIAANMHDTLDENWYSQLKHLHTTYRNVQPIQILEHLNNDGFHSMCMPRNSSKLSIGPNGVEIFTSPPLETSQ